MTSVNRILFITAGLLALPLMKIQSQEPSLLEAAERLSQVLVSGDTAELKLLVHENASYGHSNGWVETRQDMIRGLSTGYLAYMSIENDDAQWSMGEGWAVLRTKSKIAYKREGVDGVLVMHIAQVWIKTENGWRLIARQSTKI